MKSLKNHPENKKKNDKNPTGDDVNKLILGNFVNSQWFFYGKQNVLIVDDIKPKGSKNTHGKKD